MLLLAVGFVFVGASLVWEVEHETNPQFQAFGDAVWWAFSTMATLGYGTGPVSMAGRVIAGFLMVVGIACFGLVTATVTTFFVERTRGHETTGAELMAVLEDLRARMIRLEQSRTRNER